MNMSVHEYRLIAGGWLILVIFLTLFWFFTLRRLAEVLKERLPTSRALPTTFGGMFLYLFRGDFKAAGDPRLTAVCLRLRQLLYGYVGSIGAYFVYLVVFHPRY